MYYLTFTCHTCEKMLDRKEKEGIPMLYFICPECGSAKIELMLIYKYPEEEK